MNIIVSIWLTWFWFVTSCQPFDLDQTSKLTHSNESNKHYTSNKQTFEQQNPLKIKQKPIIKIKNVNIYFVDKLNVKLYDKKNSPRTSNNGSLEVSMNGSSRSQMGPVIRSLLPITKDRNELRSIEDEKDPGSKSISGIRSKLFPGFGPDLDQQDPISSKDRNDLARDVSPYDSKHIRDVLGDDVNPHDLDSHNSSQSDIKSNSESISGLQMINKVKDSLGAKLSSVMNAIENKFPETLDKMKTILVKFSDVTQKGAELALEGITLAFKEVKASELISKLEERLEQGNEIVDEFFQKIGEKVKLWSKSEKKINRSLHQHETLLTRIFQDPKIQESLSRMITAGILTKDEVQILCRYYKRSHINKLNVT